MVSRASRRARIVEDLEHLGSVSVAELVTRHGVSEMTVRRDLAQLEDEGLVRRFHGGAVLDRPRGFEPPYVLRENRRRDDKRRMAGAAVALINDGDTVALDYGTSVLAVAEALRGARSLTIVTPNLRAALELVEDPSVRVLVTGGQLRSSELALTGRDAERAFENYNVDTAIVSSAGVDAEHGLTDYNPEEVAVKKAMIAGAERVIGVVDASKFGVVAFATVVDIAQLDVLFTTAAPDDEVAQQIAARGVDVRSVGQDATSTVVRPGRRRTDHGEGGHRADVGTSGVVHHQNEGA